MFSLNTHNSKFQRRNNINSPSCIPHKMEFQTVASLHSEASVQQQPLCTSKVMDANHHNQQQLGVEESNVKAEEPRVEKDWNAQFSNNPAVSNNAQHENSSSPLREEEEFEEVADDSSEDSQDGTYDPQQVQQVQQQESAVAVLTPLPPLESIANLKLGGKQSPLLNNFVKPAPVPASSPSSQQRNIIQSSIAQVAQPASNLVVNSSNCSSPSKFDEETNHGFPYERAFCPACGEKATKGNLTFCTSCVTAKGHKVRRMVSCEVCQEHIRYNYYYQHLHKAHLDFLKDRYPRCVYLKQMKEGTLKPKKIRKNSTGVAANRVQPILVKQGDVVIPYPPHQVIHVKGAAAHNHLLGGNHHIGSYQQNHHHHHATTLQPLLIPASNQAHHLPPMECTTPVNNYNPSGLFELQKAVTLIEKDHGAAVAAAASVAGFKRLRVEEIENQPEAKLSKSAEGYRQKFCPGCGIKFGDGHKFCFECGTRRE